jgi:YfiH family protein
VTLPTPDPAFHWSREPWGDALRCAPLASHAQHLFTSRQLALPDPAAWDAALASLASSRQRLARVKQVHGNHVRVLTRGAIPADVSEQRPDGDAVVSNAAGLALAVMVADCVPILLADRIAGAAAAIHAGWRGTCAGIAREAVSAMQREFGCRPRDLVAAIGPSAGPDDYEVGEPLIDAFRAAGHPQSRIDAWFIQTGAKPRLDLWRANRDQLIDAGVTSEDIYISGLSTVSHPDIFDSYRVAGDRAGRMAAVIVVPTATGCYDARAGG